ncbi:LysR family transcriptional regulator [Baekduia sp. Peel2402]|uniref:LysR family transcriptional regulator n=1 Tax=Baekduia sp. Peel2402 TaxID=3458296 RepID=UPI00403E3A8F
MTPELRLIRYFVAVAEEGNVTRAAERLHMAQPPLSAAIRQLEQQLDVRLLDRTTRGVELTPAGALLLERGRELLREADAVAAAVRAVEKAPTGLVRVGLSPAARVGLAPALLDDWSAQAPGVMVHAREDTTGAMLRDVRAGRLDLALAFCPPPAELEGLASTVLRAEPAVVHVRDDHPLADRASVALTDLSEETLLVAGGPESPGYTAAVVAACRAAGFEPRTLADPHPDLGTTAVREGLGVTLYVATAFGPRREGTALVPVEPVVTLPFVLAWRADARSAALDALLALAPDG